MSQDQSTEQISSQLLILRGGLRLELGLMVRDSAGRHFEIVADNDGNGLVVDLDVAEELNDGQTLAEIYLADADYPAETLGGGFTGRPIPGWGAPVEGGQRPQANAGPGKESDGAPAAEPTTVDVTLTMPAKFYTMLKRMADLSDRPVEEYAIRQIIVGLDADLDSHTRQLLHPLIKGEGDTEQLLKLAGLKP